MAYRPVSLAKLAIRVPDGGPGPDRPVRDLGIQILTCIVQKEYDDSAVMTARRSDLSDSFPIDISCRNSTSRVSSLVSAWQL